MSIEGTLGSSVNRSNNSVTSVISGVRFCPILGLRVINEVLWSGWRGFRLCVGG